MSKTVRGITLPQWEVVRHHMTMDLGFNAGGTYVAEENEKQEYDQFGNPVDSVDEKAMEVTRGFIAKMDKAFGVTFKTNGMSDVNCKICRGTGIRLNIDPSTFAGSSLCPSCFPKEHEMIEETLKEKP